MDVAKLHKQVVCAIGLRQLHFVPFADARDVIGNFGPSIHLTFPKLFFYRRLRLG